MPPESCAVDFSLTVRGASYPDERLSRTWAVNGRSWQRLGAGSVARGGDAFFPGSWCVGKRCGVS